MSESLPLLIEIGVEEIPAGVAPRMGEALKEAVEKLLADANVAPENVRLGISPRRLLLHAAACPVMQADREETIWGPPERVAFTDGKATGAGIGFAKKSGLSLDDFELADKGDGKGLYMKAVQSVKGQPVADMLAAALPGILRKLPSPKQMQWQDGENRSDAFIRPVRWIVALLGDAVIPFSFAGIESGRESCGHRVHGSKGEIDVVDPFGWLAKQSVSADRSARLNDINEQLHAAAKAAKVELVEDAGLLEEVADLTEWPHVITGRYGEDFLRLPAEVSRIELKHHQRCFSTRDAEGAASNVFFAVANIASKDPAAVAKGNERVVNARLADAAFYFDRDPQETLEARVERLSQVVFQDGLGMVGDQVRRLRGFVLDNAKALGVSADDAQRAAYLCKSDLTTGLVGEFPELQGYMGGIYARMIGENEAVAAAIAGHYAPAGADDDLPESSIARAIGIAERADKLLGYFHLGRIPTASADPFGLRRAAIGLIRLLSDSSMPVDITLSRVLEDAAKQWNQQRVTIAISGETKAAVLKFIEERWLGMHSASYTRNALEAAISCSRERPMQQTVAVAELLAGFADSEAGQAVAAANKRIANILKKAGSTGTDVKLVHLLEPAEKALYEALVAAEKNFPEAAEDQLNVLATLREPVDRFFDDVMVMAEDDAVRLNRLALLNRLRQLFLKLADISRL
ncbi:MAG: glycine--tRNA ligase subunit beta [Zetaproteobacteria bacterium CG12_big_fil_rev_8_21_14_0_65_55_1124]|nr:MAG: glycine--tRNA ligase subunit beta [Zetaproteobacteria bacterium CG1_02_55_237]PIS19794.1 MAG: glycine--tRNA ligase subunit beta [Zetaproteobacteria bacterium CG08_land_8_20_14_0_20_55_17]PIW42828.1 MAG: glycine--tRNA ligase subunit beta [Zetaproteobacteria bacterium CG12_big_fil_rev_8_21_14_0_65_55_1124]PIY51641.1 MAG: glycine--tRNA ligase subunit beta [Zetaproteobacteria bacterium CG_4_10_14_0_8_um_filter_55_43]PIZ39814.1 MAG: glycine--tRNA ligase subunit beta [Zetaproteobacteria bacte